VSDRLKSAGLKSESSAKAHAHSSDNRGPGTPVRDAVVKPCGVRPMHFQPVIPSRRRAAHILTILMRAAFVSSGALP
jgi:hypothetical protein